MGKKKEPEKPGRPTLYSEELADEICRRIAEGEALTTICEAEDMPARRTVIRWLCDERGDFCHKYARARESQADFYVEKIVSVAEDRSRDHPVFNGKGDTPNPVPVQRDRLIVDSLKWCASKLAPKKYGDKIEAEVTGKDGAAIVPIINLFTKTE